MDPSLIRPGGAGSRPSMEDIKPSFVTTPEQDDEGDDNNNTLSGSGILNRPGPSSNTNMINDDYLDDFTDSGLGDGGGSGTGGESSKRPRLRLAHACDRCRKRKIRCDTQQPCGPCQATKNQCTFQTPSRRISKPKTDGNGIGSSSSGSKPSNNPGIKRPHSPSRDTSLETRLAALESMLRDVPPNVHNAFLSSLDARLGSGTGVGLKEGKGDGVGVAPEALAGSTAAALNHFATLTGDWLQSPGSTVGRLGVNSTLAPSWTSLGNRLNGRKKEEEGVDAMAKKMEGMSFFYEDEIGQPKWQGATSGFPLLELLTAANTTEETEEQPSTATTSSTLPEVLRRQSAASTKQTSTDRRSRSNGPPSPGSKKKERFFPDRTPRPHQTLNPEASWKVITGVIPPDLMDTLVRCYLSTSHLLWPFLHVPSFLADYANPSQWGEPGFACFIVAVCTLSSRHVDDPRVRASPNDPSTAGKSYFELFKRLRDLPSADRPTLYSIQAAFLAAIYAFGLGNLSKAFALQAESITLCLEGGLHRSVDGYDHFDAIEKESRKRTFWSIYSWDKQSAALFGRPAIIHLRDCDVTEPLIVDDENLSPEGVKEQTNETKSRLCAFVAVVRLHVILEGVIDSATRPSTFPTSPFLAKAASTICRRDPGRETLSDEEALLEEWTRILPKYWVYDNETTNSRDPVRITQAERLHCLEHLVKMIIYRHRFSGFVAMPASTEEERARHLDLCRKAMQCALTIVADHVHISQRGMMTYYGVHVIHQLAQAGRTLVAVILNCRNADFRPLISPAIEGLRSCVGLLRRFSGRYLCGLRSADIIDEFCRICNIPVDSPRVPDGTGRPPPAWLRPVRKRATPSPSATRASSISPAAAQGFNRNSMGEDIMSAPPALVGGGLRGSISSNISQTDLDAIFNTSDYFDLGAMSPGPSIPTSSSNMGFNSLTNALSNGTTNDFAMPANFDLAKLAGLTTESSLNFNGTGTGNGGSSSSFSGYDFSNNNNNNINYNSNLNQMSGGGSTLLGQSGNISGIGSALQFDYSGFGGEMLAGEGMDTVSDGLQGGDNQGMSAAAILSLMEEGTFDYGAIFTDQAPLDSSLDS